MLEDQAPLLPFDPPLPVHLGPDPRAIALKIVRQYGLQPADLKSRKHTIKGREIECRTAVLIALRHTFPKQSLAWLGRQVGRSSWSAGYALGRQEKGRRSQLIAERFERLTREYLLSRKLDDG